MREKAIVWGELVSRSEVIKVSDTYVNNTLDLAKHRSNRLANERNSLEETSLSDKDVE
jgi:hypothetical protein